MKAEKICSQCKLLLPVELFFRRGFHADGSIRRHSACPDCIKIYRRKHWLRTRDAKLPGMIQRNRENQIRCRLEMQIIKHECGCMYCGDKDPRALDFHHRDPSQKAFELSRAAGFGAATIAAEIAKCDVVCSSCHRKMTFTLHPYFQDKVKPFT